MSKFYAYGKKVVQLAILGGLTFYVAVAAKAVYFPPTPWYKLW